MFQIFKNRPCSRFSKTLFLMKNLMKTIFKESVTTVITCQVIILQKVRDVGGKSNFISRNLGHKELSNIRTSITVQFFPGSFVENQLRYYKSL